MPGGNSCNAPHPWVVNYLGNFLIMHCDIPNGCAGSYYPLSSWEKSCHLASLAKQEIREYLNSSPTCPHCNCTPDGTQRYRPKHPDAAVWISFSAVQHAAWMLKRSITAFHFSIFRDSTYISRRSSHAAAPFHCTVAETPAL